MLLARRQKGTWIHQFLPLSSEPGLWAQHRSFSRHQGAAISEKAVTLIQSMSKCPRVLWRGFLQQLPNWSLSPYPPNHPHPPLPHPRKMYSYHNIRPQKGAHHATKSYQAIPKSQGALKYSRVFILQGEQMRRGKFQCAHHPHWAECEEPQHGSSLFQKSLPLL